MPSPASPSRPHAGRSRAGFPPYRSRAGFSLIELLLVIGLLGILAAVTAVVVPSLRTEKLEAATGRIAAAARLAASEAVRLGIRVQLVLDPETGEYQIMGEADPVESADEFTPLDGEYGRTQTLPEGTRFGRIEVAAAHESPAPGGRRNAVAIEFTPEGTSDPANIELLSGDEADPKQGWVTVRPLPATVAVVKEEPDAVRLPDDDIADAGEYNPAGFDVEGLLTFRNGLAGNHPLESTDPDRVGAALNLTQVVTEGDLPSSGHELYGTVPGQ